MLGCILRLFGIATARSLSAEVAVKLSGYVQQLVAAGILEACLGGDWADPEDSELPEGVAPKGLGDLPLEAQAYVVSFVLQGCLEGGIEGAGGVLAVTDHVLKEGGFCTEAQARVLSVLGLRLREVVDKDPAGDDEVDRGLRDYQAIVEAAATDAKTFFAEAGSGEPRPTPQELDRFLARYIETGEGR